MDWANIAVIVGAVFSSSVLSTYIQAKATKTKAVADADATVADSASKLVETMRVDLEKLKDEMRDLRAENMLLQKRIFELEAELKIYKAIHAPLAPNVPA